MIERAEAQLRLSPQSLQLHQSLAALYRAAGRRDKLRAIDEALLKLRPNDARLRMQVATQLLQAGNTAAALDHFRALLKADPSLFLNSYVEIQRGFTRANKLDELAKLYLSIDLKDLGSPYPVTYLVSLLPHSPRMTDLAMTLLRKVWDAFPDERPMMFLDIPTSSDEFWNRPESYDYAKEAVIPALGVTRVNPWLGFERFAPANSAPDRMDAAVTRLLDAAARRNRVHELAGEVEAALGRLPSWTGGKALLGNDPAPPGAGRRGEAAHRVDPGQPRREAVLPGPHRHWAGVAQRPVRRIGRPGRLREGDAERCDPV
jgi:tetratricopeptide (TPR) repeat protein